MTSENTVTGRNGKFVSDDQLIARTTQWVVTTTLATKSEWGDSDGAGFTNRAAGRRDATFTAEGKFDSVTEVFDIFEPEDILKTTLWMDNSSLYFHFPRALCDTFSLTVNIDTEEVEAWTSSWGADGIYYRPGASGAPSETLPS